MLGLYLLVTSLGVLALGRAIVGYRGTTAALSSHFYVGRVVRRLRWLLWLSIGLKTGYCIPLYFQSALSAAFALLLSAGTTLLEFTLIFYWLYPVERAQRALQVTLREYLQARHGLVWDALAPILTAGLGALTLVFTLSGQYRAWGTLGVATAGAMGLGTLLIGLGLIRRPTPLPLRSVAAEARLLSEAQRLGRALGIQVNAILVLDGTRLRNANAFALSGGRIAITDFLLAILTEQETLAIIAHEVAHLAQRRRLARLWLLTGGAGVGLTGALAPLLAGLPTGWLLLWLGLLVGGMTAPMLRLRRLHEREADAFAVSQYGAAPLSSALRKIASIHQRAPDAHGDVIHPSLLERMAQLERYSQT